MSREGLDPGSTPDDTLEDDSDAIAAPAERTAMVPRSSQTDLNRIAAITEENADRNPNDLQIVAASLQTKAACARPQAQRGIVMKGRGVVPKQKAKNNLSRKYR